jgi:SAM-dependent methyltransferase
VIATVDPARVGRLNRLKTILACPACRGSLTYSDDCATCSTCAIGYPIRGGRIYFIDVPQRDDEMDRLKGWLKRVLGRAYYTVGVYLLAPTFPFNFGRFIARYVDAGTSMVVDAGSGNHRLHPNIICVDLFDYDAVDVVCSLETLPFKTGSIDAIVSRSVLEHVRAPYGVVREFRRCTREGGINIHMIPFVFPEHASPADFHRFTTHGHDVLFEDWDLILRTNPGGPVSAALLHFLDVAATVLSLNIAWLKSVVYLALCAVVFPLKFLDAPFVYRRAFMPSSASILSVVRKAG